MLQGKHLRLRALELSDGEKLRAWRNDPEIANKFFSQDTISSTRQNTWMEMILNRTNGIEWMIELSPHITIGTLGIEQLDYRNRHAEYVRLIIDKQYRQQGNAYEAEMLMLEYAFKYLNLNKIYCKAFCDNLEIVKLHYKTGFKEVGIWKEHIFRDGLYRDVLLLEVMGKEWLTKNS
jgi:RimJ/RimL family protein N-acetyltransferase